MLSNLVRSLLSSWLSHYISSFDEDSTADSHSSGLLGFALGLGPLWDGVLQLSNVVLAPDFIDGLELPLSLKKGCIGRLKITIPWTKLQSEPVLIEVNDANIQLTTDFRWNSERTRNAKQRQKQAVLQASEADLVIQESKVETFGQRLIANIQNNLQVAVHNLEISIENSEISQRGQKLEDFGLIIEHLSFFSTASDGLPAFVHLNDVFIHKQMHVAGLRLFVSFIKNGIRERKNFVEPLDCFLKMKFYREFQLSDDSSERENILAKVNLIDLPKFTLECSSTNLEFSLHDHYADLLVIVKEIASFKPSENLSTLPSSMNELPRPSQRPSKLKSGTVKDWWKYANSLIQVRLMKKRTPFRFIPGFHKDFRRYIEMYKRKIQGTLSKKDFEDLTHFENIYNVDQVLFARQFSSTLLNLNSPKKTSKGWFRYLVHSSKWLFSSSSNEYQVPYDRSESSMNDSDNQSIKSAKNSVTLVVSIPKIVLNIFCPIPSKLEIAFDQINLELGKSLDGFSLQFSLGKLAMHYVWESTSFIIISTGNSDNDKLTGITTDNLVEATLESLVHDLEVLKYKIALIINPLHFSVDVKCFQILTYIYEYYAAPLLQDKSLRKVPQGHSVSRYMRHGGIGVSEVLVEIRKPQISVILHHPEASLRLCFHRITLKSFNGSVSPSKMSMLSKTLITTSGLLCVFESIEFLFEAFNTKPLQLFEKFDLKMQAFSHLLDENRGMPNLIALSSLSEIRARFSPRIIEDLIRVISQNLDSNKNVIFPTVFTDSSKAEELDNDKFMQIQIELFAPLILVQIYEQDCLYENGFKPILELSLENTLFMGRRHISELLFSAKCESLLINLSDGNSSVPFLISSLNSFINESLADEKTVLEINFSKCKVSPMTFKLVSDSLHIHWRPSMIRILLAFLSSEIPSLNTVSSSRHEKNSPVVDKSDANEDKLNVVFLQRLIQESNISFFGKHIYTVRECLSSFSHFIFKESTITLYNLNDSHFAQIELRDLDFTTSSWIDCFEINTTLRELSLMNMSFNPENTQSAIARSCNFEILTTGSRILSFDDVNNPMTVTFRRYYANDSYAEFLSAKVPFLRLQYQPEFLLCVVEYQHVNLFSGLMSDDSDSDESIENNLFSFRVMLSGLTILIPYKATNEKCFPRNFYLTFNLGPTSLEKTFCATCLSQHAFSSIDRNDGGDDVLSFPSSKISLAISDVNLRRSPLNENDDFLIMLNCFDLAFESNHLLFQPNKFHMFPSSSSYLSIANIDLSFGVFEVEIAIDLSSSVTRIINELNGESVHVENEFSESSIKCSTINLDQLTFKLLRKTIMFDIESDSSSDLFCAVIHNVSLVSEIQERSKRAQLLVKTMSISDSRKRSHYSLPIFCHNEINQGILCKISLAQNDGSGRIDIFLSSFQMSLDTELLSESLYAFQSFIRNDQSSLSIQSPSSKSENSANLLEQMNFHCEGFEFFTFSSRLSFNSGVLLRASSKYSLQRSTEGLRYCLRVDDLQFFIAHRSSLRYLFDASKHSSLFHTPVNFELSSKVSVGLREIFVDIWSKLEVFVSFQDLLLMSKFFSEIQQLTLIFDAKTGPSMNSKQNSNVHLFKLQTSKCRVVLFNDTPGYFVPLLIFGINNADIIVHVDSSRNMKGILSFIAEIDYYNRSIKEWEPMVEPYHLSVAVSHDLGTGWNVKLTSDERLTLNMSESACISLLSLYDVSVRFLLPQLHSSSEDRKSADNGNFLHVKNETGARIRLLSNQTFNRGSESIEPLVIEAGAESLFEVTQLLKTGSRHYQDYEVPSVDLEIEGPAGSDVNQESWNFWHKIRNVYMDIGHGRLLLEERGSPRYIRLLSKMFFSSKKRIFSIMSPVFLRNDMDVNLTITVSGSSGIFWEHSLLPSVEVPIPLYLLSRYDEALILSMSPLFPAQYSPCFTCTLKDLQPSSSSLGPSLLRCPRVDLSSQSDCFYAIFRKNAQVNEFDRVIATFSPSISVKNYLPKAINLQLGSKDNVSHRNLIEIPPNEKCFMSCVNPTQGLKLLAFFPGFSPLEYFNIEPDYSMPSIVEFEGLSWISDNGGKFCMLRFLVECERHGSSGISVEEPFCVYKISIFSKHWLVNKTGMNLIFGQLYTYGSIPVAGQDVSLFYRKKPLWESSALQFINSIDRPPWYALAKARRMENEDTFDGFSLLSKQHHGSGWTPSMLSANPAPFSTIFDFDGSKHCLSELCIRLPNTNWSRGFSIDSLKIENVISLQDSHVYTGESSRSYDIAVHVSDHPEFPLCRLIVFSPRYVFSNHSCRRLAIRQDKTFQHEVVDSDCTVSVNRLDHTMPGDFRIKFLEYGWHWSGSFNFETLGTTSLRLMNSYSRESSIININCTMENAIYFIKVLENDKVAPYKIENYTYLTLVYKQEGSATTEELLPYHSKSYAWEEPLHSKELSLSALVGGSSCKTYKIGKYNLDKISEYSPVKLALQVEDQGEDKGMKMPISKELQISVVADGPIRVLRITDTLVHSEEDYFDDFSNNSTEVSSVRILADLKGVEISFISEDRNSYNQTVLKELALCSMDSICFRYDESRNHTGLSLSVHNIQLDNMLEDCTFPVILKGSSSRKAPVLSIELIRNLRYSSSNSDFISLLSTNINPLKLNVEPEIIWRIYNSVQRIESKVGELTLGKDATFSSHATLPKSIYLQMMNISSIQIAFSLKSSRNSASQSGFWTPFSILRALRLSLSNIENAPIFFKSVHLVDHFGTYSETLEKMRRLYTNQVYAEGLKILGSVDFFGNPIGLFRSFFRGFTDLVHEPWQGLVATSLSGFLNGIRKGISSFFLNSLYGVFDALTKITETIPKALGSLVFCKDKDAKSPIGGFRLGLSSSSLFISEGFRSRGFPGAFSGLLCGISDTCLLTSIGSISVAYVGLRRIRDLLNPSKEFLRRRSPRLFFKGSIIRPRWMDNSPEFLSIWLEYQRLRASEGIFEENFWDLVPQSVPGHFLLHTSLGSYFLEYTSCSSSSRPVLSVLPSSSSVCPAPETPS